MHSFSIRVYTGAISYVYILPFVAVEINSPANAYWLTPPNNWLWKCGCVHVTEYCNTFSQIDNNSSSFVAFVSNEKSNILFNSFGDLKSITLFFASAVSCRYLLIILYTGCKNLNWLLLLCVIYFFFSI